MNLYSWYGRTLLSYIVDNMVSDPDDTENGGISTHGNDLTCLCLSKQNTD